MATAPAAGLLREARATLHRSVPADLAEHFPQVVISTERHVMERRVWRCGAAARA